LGSVFGITTHSRQRSHWRIVCGPNPKGPKGRTGFSEKPISISKEWQVDDSGPVRVLFLDGLGCNPVGFKPTWMRKLGYDVTAPQLPDLDFPSAVRIAEQSMRDVRPHIIVGYSRGAGVAMMIDDESIPRLLIAPSLHWVADGRRFSGRMVVLHSPADDSLPIDGVRQQLLRCGVQNDVLLEVGEDHTMIDRAALDATQAALVLLSGR
jgi:hypothetical protein